MSTRKYLQMKKHLPLEERVAQIFLERIGDWSPPPPGAGPRPANGEIKYPGPNGEMIDVSEHGWVGTRGFD